MYLNGIGDIPEYFWFEIHLMIHIIMYIVISIKDFDLSLINLWTFFRMSWIDTVFMRDQSVSVYCNQYFIPHFFQSFFATIEAA
jgi:hypothetical protein